MAAPTDAAAATVEHRGAVRHPASAVPSITGIRLKPHGAEATLVNISETGVLVECASRIKPGTAVIVVFEGTFSPSSVEARVARSSVAIMHKNGGLGYHTGIAFNRPIELAGLLGETRAPAMKAVDAHAPEIAAPASQAPAAAHSVSVPLFNRW